jgi:hypothetical protein
MLISRSAQSLRRLSQSRMSQHKDEGERGGEEEEGGENDESFPVSISSMISVGDECTR